MPPSGYSIKQSESINDFLRSISDSLKLEGLSLGLSPVEALNKEINNIEEIILLNEFSDLSNIVLLSTKYLI